MSNPEISDETLMAFADGELDEAACARLEEALAQDDALAERLAVFLDTRQLLASALKPLIDEPVPDALMANVRGMASDALARQTAGQASGDKDNVLAFRKRPTPANDPHARPRWMMPVAACLIASIGGIAGYTVGRGLQPSASGTDLALDAALDSQPSGQDIALGETGQSLQIVSSFRDDQGNLCREYELKDPKTGTFSIACRENGAWTRRLALSTVQTGNYVPASAQDTIDAYLSSIQAGEPLTPQEEREALSSLK